MQLLSSQLKSLIDQHRPNVEAISSNEFSLKSSPVKWSKKEILGHLIDSALNNLRRFIVAQYEDEPKIVYNQDEWVIINRYQQWEMTSLIELWYLLNKQICIVWETMPADRYDRKCMTQATHSLHWLAEDYIKHMLHHMHVILDLEPIAYP